MDSLSTKNYDKNKLIEDQNNISLYITKNNIKEKKIGYNYYKSSFLNKIFFNWSKKAILTSNKRKLKISDINDLHEEQMTKFHIKKLIKEWDKFSSNKKEKYPLIKSLFMIHYIEMIKLFIIDIILIIFQYTLIYFYRQIINHFSTGEFNSTNLEELSNSSLKDKIKKYQFDIYTCTFMYIILKILLPLFSFNFDFRNFIFKERITNQMIALVYEKILKANSNNTNLNEGEKMNLIQIDCERISYLFYIGPKMLTIPFRVIIALIFLFEFFGYNFIYSLGILIILLLFIFILQYFYLKNLKEILLRKDKRLKIVIYVFHMLKNIKINGWEEVFSNKIKEKRDDELYYIKKNLNLSILRYLINANLPLILLIISIGNYVYTKKTLEITNIFTSFQLINSLTKPLMSIPSFLKDFQTNLISISRLEKFLTSNEHDYTKHEDLSSLIKDNILIKFDKATFGIKINEKNKDNNYIIREENELEEIGNNKKKRKKSFPGIPTEIKLLSNISLTIKKGEFIGIIGSNGSGKTTLINSILNNYKLLESSSPIIINGNISYTPQNIWLMNDTIRNNILLYNKMIQEKYNKVINVCQLNYDFDLLQNGDLTEINLGANNLSGGQKQRISIARCLYKDSDLYLFDDIFSSIDNKVSNIIFNNIFNDFLKGKSRVLVTNEINKLSYFDKIIYLDKGEIIFYGNYEEFKQKFGEKYFSKHFEFIFNNINNDNFIKDNFYKKNNSDKSSSDSNNNDILRKLNKKIKILNSDFEKSNITLPKIENPLQESDKKTLYGKFSFKIYNTFIKIQGGYLIFIIIIIFIIFSRILNSYRTLFVTSWSKSRRVIKKKNIPIEKQTIDNYNKFYQYLKLSLYGIIINVLIEFLLSRMILYSQKFLHENIAYKFIRAPINLFHDLVPIGQIITRLTRDISMIQGIIKSNVVLIRSIFSLISSIYICIKFNKSFIFIAPIITIINIFISLFYYKFAREIVIIQKNSYSPIINVLSESFLGVEIIRTAGVELNSKYKFYKTLDNHLGSLIYSKGSRKYYLMRLKFNSLFFLISILLYIIFNKENFTAQAVGLILQYLENFNSKLSNLLHFFININSLMISVERCESALNTKSEKNPNKNEEIIIKDKFFPKEGKIEFINFSAKYRPFTPVILKNINLKINQCERVGIIGRTGSGKTSLINSIFRIIEGFEGKILIDDIDINKLNLDFLRQNLTIVTQEPFLLEGTLRENIDPLNLHSEKEIIEILDSFCLFNEIQNNYRRLKIEIKENGNNLSIGEKQLICFARAALKKSKIIILDEATSSLDYNTEKIINENMEKMFKDCTIILITHRFNVVKICEKVFVVDNGEIIEKGVYGNLIKDKKSKFSELYSEIIS